jgi:hypothetical protein
MWRPDIERDASDCGYQGKGDDPFAKRSSPMKMTAGYWRTAALCYDGLQSVAGKNVLRTF